MQERMARVPAEERRRLARKASAAALETLPERADPLVKEFSAEAVQQVRRIMVGARKRCENPNDVGYPNYGGRGIEFRFPSTRAGYEWVLRNLGPPPPGRSIDRIDNDAHYEPGNLRWATAREQNRNKRQYRRTSVGERIRALSPLRPDLTYETLRQWIHKGLSDEEILGRKKYAGPGV